MQYSCLVALATFLSAVHAHPGHDISEEVAERRHFVNSIHRKDLSHCAESLRARGVEARSIARRSAAVEEARARRGVSRRDLEEVLSASHDQSDTGYTENTDASKLFSGNASCILTPEVTQDVGGEFVREDITDDEPGVDITLDYQVIDVDTCEPVPDVYVEIWHCNSTGVYSGVVANGNGNTDDESNLDATFLRGIQETDSDGVATFKSTFPGHYTGRATHIHVMVHTNATLLANDTLGNDIYASHVGQAFFDQDLITAVEKTSPYSTNTQDITLNSKDSILAEEAEDVDPFMDYVYLGDDLDSGLFAWIAFGINTSYSSHVTPAASYYEDGGVANEDSGTSTSTGAAGVATLPALGAIAGSIGLAIFL
ncbi:aromatic compound dioxygenase [Sarocladium strictum]